MIPTLAEIYEEFTGLDPEDQSLFLLELGDDLEEFPDSARTTENLVQGCQSQVWLTAHVTGTGAESRIQLVADSDSAIVRGLIVILQAAYSGLTAREIAEFDIQSVFRSLNLQQHISPQRRNGLRGMVERILLIAANQIGSAAELSAPEAVRSVRQQRSAAADSSVSRVFDAAAIRAQFPVLNRPLAGGLTPVYLDSGASAQKPQAVIEKQREVEEQYFSNAHRGTYQLGVRIDEELEGARERIASFLDADSPDRIVFTPGTTAGLNYIAAGWGRRHVGPGDRILTTIAEHHANFVPWQQLARERQAELQLIPLTEDGRIDLSGLDELLTENTRIVAVSGMSNMLGTINPVAEIARRARAAGACVVVDGAQSVPHLPVSVQHDDVDFLVFSGHKLYGPTGVGVLYGKAERLDEMDPVFFGGHMIDQVGVSGSTWAKAPAKFEAGTAPIVQAIGLGEAVRWTEETGLAAIHAHEQSLVQQIFEGLQQVSGVRIFGPAPEHRGGIVSFCIDGIHPEDLAALLDECGVFTRHGHHCTMPLHASLQITGTTRVSFAAYNTSTDVELFLTALQRAVSILRR